MPGVSHRGPVKGAEGLGKVHLKFKPKPPPKGHRFLAVIVYSVLFTTMFMSFSWTRPYLKDGYVVPALRNVVKFADKLKLLLSAHQAPELGQHVDGNDNVHIVAENMTSALYAQGYLHASDRLLQMEILRRTALGTLSEFYGNSTVESDKFYRTLNLVDLSTQDYTNLESLGARGIEYRESLVAYSAGVNAYLLEASKGEFGGSLPLDFDLLFGLASKTYQVLPWEPSHTLAVARLVAYEWGSGWDDSLKTALFSKVGHLEQDGLWFSSALQKDLVAKTSLTVVPSLNGVAVAVSGARSETGSALLANSINTVSQHSGLWYFNSLRVAGKLDVSGAAVPGIPFVLIGRNQDISWGFTPSAHSDSEGFNAPAEGEVVTEREEIIRVRGEAEALVHIARTTARGPCLVDHLTPSVANVARTQLPELANATVRVAALRAEAPFVALQQLNQASDFEEFGGFARANADLGFNFVYADKRGNVGLIGPSSTDAVYNPSNGIIVAAPASTSVRICALLDCDSASKVSLTAVQGVLTDTFSPSAVLLRDYITAMYGDATVSLEKRKELLAAKLLVQKFDGLYHTDSAAAVLLEAFRVVLVNSLLRPMSVLSSAAAGTSIHAGRRVAGVSARSELEWFFKNFLPSFIAAPPVDAPTCSAEEASTGTCAAPATPTTTSTSASVDVEWWRQKLHRAPEKIAQEALLEAIDWSTETFGKNMTAWKWGTAHPAYYHHSNPAFNRLLDELLTRGPVGSAGTVDSLLRSDYFAVGGLLTAGALQHTENAPSTSIRVVFDMSEERCYYGFSPTERGQRPVSHGFGGVNRLQRWSSADPSIAYDKICHV